MARHVNLISRLASLVPVALVAACATPSDYPSLAIRPAERVHGTFTTEPPAEPAMPSHDPSTAPPANLEARLAALVSDSKQTHAQFLSAVPQTTDLVAAAGEPESDSWASAQVALADLESTRSRAAVPLADIDTIFVDETLADRQHVAVQTARNTILELLGEEDLVLAQLRQKVPG